MYDITQAKSFANIKTWIKNIEEHASGDVEKMIIGNKCDMNDKRAISTEDGQKVGSFKPTPPPPPPLCRVPFCFSRRAATESPRSPLQLANEYSVPFMETSAKKNINIEEAFMQIARAIKKKTDHRVRRGRDGRGTLARGRAQHSGSLSLLSTRSH